MYKSEKTGAFGIFITIVLLILIVVLSNVTTEKFSIAQNVASKIITPIQNGVVFLKNKIEGNSTFFLDITDLKEENKKLKEENSNLEASLRELEIIKTENATLKEYVNLTEKYTDYKTMPAYIIDKDSSNYSKTIVINVGEKDGIKKNMTVISDKGLVGHIISVEANSSKVELIIDPASSVSSTLSTSNDIVICKGTLDSNISLKAMYVPIEATLVKGDSVETSGMGGIYPKGIHIGTIEDVIDTKNSTDRYAIIKTAVDFTKMQTVLVIVN